MEVGEAAVVGGAVGGPPPAVTVPLRLLAAVAVVQPVAGVSVAPAETTTEPRAETATVRAREPAPDRGPGVTRQDLEAPQSPEVARRTVVVLCPGPAEGPGSIRHRQ